MKTRRKRIHTNDAFHNHVDSLIDELNALSDAYSELSVSSSPIAHNTQPVTNIHVKTKDELIDEAIKQLNSRGSQND